MRRGSVFRRCTACKKRVKARRCPCGRGKVVWAFVVDLNPPGESRRQRTSSGYATEAEATAAMNRLQNEKAEGSYVEPSKIAVGRYLREWVKGLGMAPAREDDEEAEELRANTVTGYESYVRLHLAPEFESVPLQQLSQQRVRAGYRVFRAKVSKRGRPLSAKTLWNLHLCLHKALDDAIKDGLIKNNPATKAMRKPKDRPEIAFWVGAELACFLMGVKDIDERTLYRIAGQTGMRLGELLGLRWRDVDLDHGFITVQHQLVRQRGQGYRFGPPKTKKGRRTIEASPDTVMALRSHRGQQELYRRHWGDAYEVELDLVFCREDGSRHDPTQIGKRFGRGQSGRGLPRLRFHDLRHTSAVIGLRELGEWPDETCARLGHTSVAFTLDTYGHLLPKRGKQVAVAFDRLLREAMAS